MYHKFSFVYLFYSLLCYVICWQWLLSFVLLRTWYIIPHIIACDSSIRPLINLCISTSIVVALSRKNSHTNHRHTTLFPVNCCMVPHSYNSTNCCIVVSYPTEDMWQASNTVSQFQQRLLHCFRNQNSTTFPEDHCCIIICRLRGLGSSILSICRPSYPFVGVSTRR